MSREELGDDKCILSARKEYMEALVNHIYTGLYEGISSIWKSTISDEKYKQHEIYLEFQKKLKKIRNWNQDIIIS